MPTPKFKVKDGRGRPKGDELLEKVTVNLRAGDMDWLQIMRGAGEASRLIRKLVSEYVDQNQRPEPMDLDATIESLKDE